MKALVIDGVVKRIYKTPKGITLGGIQYPRNIFTLWSLDELAAIGLLPYSETTVDTRYYNSGAVVHSIANGAVIGTPTSTGKDVAQLKKQMLASIRSQVASKQGAIDWYWLRASKGGKAVPTTLETYAASVYSTMDTKEAEVAALVTMDDIKLYQNTPMVETRKIKHTSEEGVETYGPETETNDCEVNNVMFGWPVSPNDEVDLSFVSIVVA